MDPKQKEEIVLNSLKGMESLNGEMHHPEGALFVSSIYVDDEKSKVISGIIGCKHGVIDALVQTAEENDVVRSAILKAAKILKKIEKGESSSGLPPKLEALLGLKRKSNPMESGKRMLEKSARKFIESIGRISPEEKKTIAKQFSDELESPFFPRLENESCHAYMTRVTKGNCPEIVLDAAKLVDETNLAAEPAS